MFCGNCGTEIQDGLTSCPKCKKSPNRVDVRISDYPLINLSAKLYTLIFEISLWLILIVGTVAGGVVGSLLNRSVLLGVVVGFIIGFVLMIQTGGLVSVFLKIIHINSDKDLTLLNKMGYGQTAHNKR